MKIKAFITNKYLKLSAKILLTILCFYILCLKVDLIEVGKIIRTSNIFLIIVSIILFILSKYLSALRLNIYFESIGLSINKKLNIKLYLLGMFYNLFLPGGIGGDGYKAYYLKKRNESISIKNILIALLFDRLNGFFILSVLISVLFYFVDFTIPYKNLLIIGSILLYTVAAVLISYFFLKASLKRFISISLYSLGVQISQLLSVLLIIYALHIYNNVIEISFVFLISGITVMMPFTIGGTGLRELTFIYFSQYFHYDKNYSVSVAVFFFFITILISLAGIYYSIRPKELES